MAWTLNGVRVYIYGAPESKQQIIARHNVLAGGTVHQAFGYEDETLKLKGVVVGTANAAALKTLTTSGTTLTLVTPWSSKSVWVENVSVSPKITISQTIDTAQDCGAVVYDLDLDLLVEE